MRLWSRPREKEVDILNEEVYERQAICSFLFFIISFFGARKKPSGIVFPVYIKLS